MTTRTDIHRPVEMDPANYEYVAAFDNTLGWAITDFGLEIARKIGRDDHLGRGVSQCHHCGAHIRYFAVLEYTPTGEYIVVGETCVDNRFALRSKAEFDRLRKAAALDRQNQRIKTAAAAFVASLEGEARIALDRETDLAETFGFDPTGYSVRTITDIRRKIWDRYGDASERQVAFVERLIIENRGEVAKRAAAQAARDAEAKVPAPEGRQIIEGTVVSRKGHDSEWGFAWKITVKVETEAGVWLCWMTEPSKGPETKRGDKIRVTATVNRGDRDASFAFGKRPSGLIITEVAGAELPEADSLTD